NVTFPMAAMGLAFGPALLLSMLGGLVAAASTYHLFGRGLSSAEATMDETLHHRVADDAKGVLDVINRAGAEAFKISIGAIPMLVLALVAVMALRASGGIDLLTALLTPLLRTFDLDPALILLTLTKYIAGGTAMMGVMDEMLKVGATSIDTLNASAGFLIHPFDVAGVAVLISAGRRVAAVWKPAALGAVVGIGARTIGHALL
ncbi:MAG TPA: nucleoside recognition family protein, partial [Thauera sp.]|nr:nucleoside recognition family protein [Thauera sp.]